MFIRTLRPVCPRAFTGVRISQSPTSFSRAIDKLQGPRVRHGSQLGAGITVLRRRKRLALFLRSGHCALGLETIV
jgi:hypothetical protein